MTYRNKHAIAKMTLQMKNISGLKPQNKSRIQNQFRSVSHHQKDQKKSEKPMKDIQLSYESKYWNLKKHQKDL